jgi:CTP synthase (UTP-ammonia lyase)
MERTLRVGIIGDFNPKSPSHTATNEALSHAASAVSLSLDCSWLPTPSLDDEGTGMGLKQFDALWCAPGSPYKSINGAMRAIQFARENDWPFVGT